MSMCCCAQGCSRHPLADRGVWPECSCWCHDRGRIVLTKMLYGIEQHFARCLRCDWIGPSRSVAQAAREDAERHGRSCRPWIDTPLEGVS